MVALAPIPPNEEGRLRALHSYQIIDTAPDERFDLFTRLGTWLFDVPVSAINLVDADRTFFKSLTGLAAYEPRRCTSICAHAVGIGKSILVIEDLAADERFNDHPLLTKKGLRFYAGALLRSDRDDILGTLCIADRQPRSFSAADQAKLVELAHGVGAVMELHRRGLWLQQAAAQDALTGLANRRAFEAALDEALANAVRGESVGVLYIDLDRFKAVNDTLGHAGGDALLCEVGRRIKQTIGPRDLAARLGGDEFVVLLSSPTGTSHAESMAQRLLEVFAEPHAIAGRIMTTLSSIGVALFPQHARDRVSLLECADRALYEAKRLGRGRYCIHAQLRGFDGAFPALTTAPASSSTSESPVTLGAV